MSGRRYVEDREAPMREQRARAGGQFSGKPATRLRDAVKSEDLVRGIVARKCERLASLLAHDEKALIVRTSMPNAAE